MSRWLKNVVLGIVGLAGLIVGALAILAKVTKLPGVSGFGHELRNDRVQRIEFLSANITQDQGIIVGRETCPDCVAKPRLAHPGEACHSLDPAVRHANSLDRRFVPSLENVDKSAVG